jgi:hypothetical protein
VERPSGISLYGKSSKKGSSNPSSLEEIIFCSGPLINELRTKFFVKPTIFNYQGNFDTINTLYEFEDEDLGIFNFVEMDIIFDERGMPVIIEGERVMRPTGLNSDTTVLRGGNVLFSTTKSNKILDLTGGIRDIYLENDDLIGINNMVYGSDDKIYLTQIAIRDELGDIVRPKRVISLDSNKNLNVEFELPSEQNSGFYEPIRTEFNSLYGGNFIEIGSQIRIIENLDKKVDPSKVYVMDQLSRAIYKNTGNNLVNLLENSEPHIYPSGIAAEINGKIFYITSPVIYSNLHPDYNAGLAFQPQLRVFDPKKLEDTVLYTFEGGGLGKYLTGREPYEIEINGEKYWLPINFLMTLGAVQVDNNLNIYFTDNVAGDFGILSSFEEQSSK